MLGFLEHCKREAAMADNDPDAPYLINIDGLVQSFNTLDDALFAAGYVDGQQYQKVKPVDGEGTFIVLGRKADG